jgi:hypothetical protein
VSATDAPGSLVTAVPTAGNNSALQSIAMFYVGVHDAEGQPAAARVYLNLRCVRLLRPAEVLNRRLTSTAVSSSMMWALRSPRSSGTSTQV